MKNTTTQLCPFARIFCTVSSVKNISAEQFGQDSDLINCLTVINRKIKQLVILLENVFSKSRIAFSRGDRVLND